MHPSGEMPNLPTIQRVLQDKAEAKNPGRIFCYPFGEAANPKIVTYTQLFHQAKVIARTIQGLKNYRVAHPIILHFDDHWDVILWFWAVLLAGGLPVLSSPFSNIDEDRRKQIENLAVLLQAPLCFTRSKLVPLFGSSHDIHVHSIETIFNDCDEKTSTYRKLHATYEDHSSNNFTNGHGNDTVSNPVRDLPTEGTDSSSEKTSDNNKDKSPLMLMLTSGSTGNAKAVCFTHEQVLAAVSGKSSIRNYPRDRSLLNWVGLDHVAGLIEIHLQALWLGLDQVHVSAADIVTSPTTFLEMISRHRVALTFAPNFFLAKLVATYKSIQQPSELDLSSLVSVTSGGEANDTKTCVAASALFSRYGAPSNVLIPGFGMTETCAGSIYNTICPEYDVARGHTVASLGKCMPGIEMRIVLPEGNASPNDESGDLEVRGKVVFKGYYRNESATNSAFAPGQWFRTGDRGFIDSNGNLNLVGRAKEVININGIKIVAADIQTAVENALGDRVARLVVFSTVASHTERVTVAYIPKEFPTNDGDAAEIARVVTQTCVVRTASKPLVFALREETIPLLPVSTLGMLLIYEVHV